MLGGRRGFSRCAECSTLNGNRAQRCGVSIRKVAKFEQPQAQHSTNVTSLLPPEDAANLQAVYSVRVRDQGSDYRCFVSLSMDGVYKCYFRDCTAAEDARARSLEEGA